MSHGTHSYRINVRWTGNNGTGTSDYRAYERAHEITGPGKAIVIPGSSDPAFRGDAARYNPEDMLVASLSTCHLLSYLHLCAVNSIVVTDYVDDAEGVMVQTDDGGGHFTDVVLRPLVTISSGDMNTARELHEQAHHLCFIANSVNFTVRCESTIKMAG